MPSLHIRCVDLDFGFDLHCDERLWTVEDIKEDGAQSTGEEGGWRREESRRQKDLMRSNVLSDRVLGRDKTILAQA